MEPENNFHIKYIFAFVAVLILVGGVYFYNFKNLKSNTAPAPIVTAMTGHITEVKENGIIVKGSVGSESKVIELTIRPETVFIKSVIGITAAQAKSGKSFAPETKILPGQASDLAKDMLVRIKTAENLLLVNKTQAMEINYTTHDFQF